MSLFVIGVASASRSTPIDPVPSEAFSRVVVPYVEPAHPTPTASSRLVVVPVEVTPDQAPARRPAQVIPKPKPRTVPRPSPVRSSKPSAPRAATKHSISGKASWYCKAGVSVCHHSYPPGSMVAAACGKLRSAMGSRWRGKTVTVSTKTRTVSVKLVDWCGSKDKTIDLYWEPMRRLGGSGVLAVTVRW